MLFSGIVSAYPWVHHRTPEWRQQRQDDHAGHKAYRDHFNAVIKPIHDDYNEFLASTGEAAYPIGQFFEASPFMNLLLYPDRGLLKLNIDAGGVQSRRIIDRILAQEAAQRAASQPAAAQA